ncbi:TRAP transporter small permease [Calditrichota bacterium GD2]
MNWIKRVDQFLAKIELVFLLLIVLVMVFMSGLQIFLRKVFNVGILWGDIFLRNLVLWVSFIGASLAAREGKHINIDLLTRLTPARWRKIPKTIVYLFAIFITALLTRASLTFVLDEREFGTTIFSDIPAWPFQTIIPIGFALMALRFFFNLLLLYIDPQEPEQ